MNHLRSTIAATLCSLTVWANAADLGTFIQLNRDYAEKSVEEWSDDLARMKSVGIQSLIVQWSSEPPIVYFDYPVKRVHYFEESYPVLERIFEANQDHKLDIHLGLQNNPYFWTQIKGRDRVLRDFFLLRIARNERLQVALLERFDDQETWKGYYIPDEIDDFTWRHESKLPTIRKYIHHLAERIHVNDPNRTISVSAFFRGRTSPNIVAENLLMITAGSYVDHLLLQDGVGVGDPPIEYLPLYYQNLSQLWAKAKESPEWLTEFLPFNDSDEEDATEDNPSEDGQEDKPSEVEPMKIPTLWSVVETFKQTSGPEEPFTARPGTVDSVSLQIQEAEKQYDTIIFFTFLDYMSPDLGKEAEALFDLLKEKATATP